jgi:hypothetical protein
MDTSRGGLGRPRSIHDDAAGRGLGRVGEVAADPVLDHVGVAGDAADGDGPVRGLLGELAKDLQSDGQVLADPLLERPAGFVVGDEELFLLRQAEQERVLAVEEELDRLGARRLVEEGDGRFEEEGEGRTVVADLPVGQPAEARRRRLDVVLEPNVAILTDLSGATMLLVTGNIVSAPWTSTATSTFSRRMSSMAPNVTRSMSGPPARPGQVRLVLRTSM